jgi:hypothetical protein
MTAPPDDSLKRRLALAASVAVYLLYSSFGFAHPVLWGHYGHHTSEYLLRALATLRFGLVVAATSPGPAAPRPETIYLHHPIGYHHLYAPLVALFGNHAWLGAVVPVATGLVLLFTLHGLVRCFWGAWPAVLAVALWVMLPFVWSFSILTDAMFPAMACSIAATHAFLHYIESPSPRRLVEGALATAVGALLMWESAIQTVLFGAVAYVWSRRRPEARLARLPAGALWFAATAIVIYAALAFHLELVVAHGRVADLVKSHQERSHGGLLPTIQQVVYWMFLLYGPAIEAVGVIWLALFAARARRGEARLRDVAVFTFFAINLVYIVLFSQAVVVHLYRVFWMSTSFVLASVDLAVELHARVAARRRAGAPGISPTRATAIALALFVALVLPQSIYDLIRSRALGGSQGFVGYDSEQAKMRFADEVARWSCPDDVVAIAASIPHRVELLYHLDRTTRDVASLAEVTRPGGPPFSVVLTDAEPPPSERAALATLLAQHPARRVERWLMIDLRAHGSDLRTFALRPRAPSWTWRWFVSHRYPPLDLEETTARRARP